MADILVVCGECGAENSLSEYVDPEQAACKSCGAKLNVPGTGITGPKAPPKTATKPKGPSALEKSTTAALTASKARRSRVHKRKAVTSWTPNKFVTWLLFAFGTITLCLLRFKYLEGTNLKTMTEGALFALLVLHFTVVADAFADNMLTGMLCVFIPGYSIFYLYTLCDSFILRVVIGMLLVPFGLDAVALLFKWVKQGLYMLTHSEMFGTYD